MIRGDYFLRIIIHLYRCEIAEKKKRCLYANNKLYNIIITVFARYYDILIMIIIIVLVSEMREMISSSHSKDETLRANNDI